MQEVIEPLTWNNAMAVSGIILVLSSIIMVTFWDFFT